MPYESSFERKIIANKFSQNTINLFKGILCNMKFKIKGILVKTLLIILAVSFVLFGIINFFGGVGQTNILKVNSEKISVNRFAKYLNDRKNQAYYSDMADADLDYFNSKEFIRVVLSEFVNEVLFENKIKQLDLEEPKEAILEAIYNDKNFKDSEGKFDVDLFKNILSRNNMTESAYIDFLSSFNSRNNLLQLLVSTKLTNKDTINMLFEKENRYMNVDIASINPEDIKFKYKAPEKIEIEKYYNENKKDFFIPDEKTISFVDVDLSKYTDEKAKIKLSELEDSVLSFKNIDEVASKFNAKKNTISYSERNKNIPQDLTIDILQYDAGTFSDLIYKDNSVYRVYYIEKVVPSRYISLQEATPKITNILSSEHKKENDMFILEKILVQMKNNDIGKVAFKNGMRIKSNEVIYTNNTQYSDEFLNELFNVNSKNSYTKPVYDNEKKVYMIGYVKDIKKLPSDDTRFLSHDSVNNKMTRLYGNSIIRLFQQYLFDSNNVIVNEKLFNTF